MSLTGSTLQAVVVVLAVVVPFAIVLSWHRWPAGAVRVVLSLLSVLLCQVLAITAAGVVANNQFGFYNSWEDLLGKAPQAPQAPTVNGQVPTDGSQGSVVALSVALPADPGVSAGTRMSTLVWLPKEYDQPQYRKTKFPVVMVLPGQPGTPQGMFRQFDFGNQATQAIAQRRVRPFVAVFPPIMIAPPRDTECTDVPGGPQAESWLFRNVRDAVIKHLRVTADGRQWSTMGWSTGGFCAAKLLLRHRNLFNAAVGIGGYYDAETDRSTGNLFKGNRQLRDQNSPLWLVQHSFAPRTNLLIIVSRLDRSSYNGVFYADSKKMIEVTQGVPGVSTILLREGGHNYRVYRPTVAEALPWLGQNAGL